MGGFCDKENENKVVSAILKVFKKSGESLKKEEFSQLCSIIANFRLKALARWKANGVNRTKERYFSKNEEWLKSRIALPISIISETMGHMVKFGCPECNLEEVGSPSRRSKTKTIRQSNSCEKLSEKEVQGGPKYYIMIKILKN